MKRQKVSNKTILERMDRMGVGTAVEKTGNGFRDSPTSGEDMRKGGRAHIERDNAPHSQRRTGERDRTLVKEPRSKKWKIRLGG